MMNFYLAGLLGVAIVSLIPLIGFSVLVVNKEKMEKYSHLLVSFAVGALLGNAIIHILPEIFETETKPLYISISIIAGVLLFYGIEQFLSWRHCHEQTSLEHSHPVGLMSQIGDSVHNFIDGTLIATSFAVDVRLGWTTVLAVILHEIPQEIADFGVLLYAKWPVKKIVLVNLLSAVTAFAGLAIGFWLSNSIDGFNTIALSVTAGGFIYIACTDLIPDLHEKGAGTARERFVQLIVILTGILIFVVL
jgi:zinc and cadmium transporter